MLTTNDYGLLQLIFGPLIVLGILLAWYLWLRSRKSKDIYGFELEGWKVLSDDNSLYEIERLFTDGLVAQALHKLGYGISDWHSNIQKIDEPSVVTGFIQLLKSNTVLTTSGSNDRFYEIGIAIQDSEGFRYYRAPLSHPIERLLVLNSNVLGSASLNREPSPLIQALQGPLSELEKSFGIATWSVLAHDSTLVVLVPEIFDRALLLRFLEISERLRATLSQVKPA